MKKIISAASITLAITLALGGCAAVEQTSTQKPVDDPIKEQLFHNWFAAEFDNHEQNWQDKIDKVKNEELQVHEHIHHIFAPVPTPALEGKTYFVKQYMDGDVNKVYRQRLYQFIRNEEKGAVQLNIYRFKDEAKYADAHLNPAIYQTLTTDEITTYPGCEVYWQWNTKGEYFDGIMGENTCAIKSKRSGKMMYFNDTLRLTDNEIWISDTAHDEDGKKIFGNKQGIAHINRKVTYFEGWGGNRLGGKDAPDDAKWGFNRGITIHNEGQIWPLVDSKTGEETGYSIQLAQLTYQNTTDPILKFGLIDNKTGKTITYIWGDRTTVKIGMNLRWMQAGLKVKEVNPHFGF
ncbi:chromophore lyase CpcT/CpeT [Psychrosphaera sp. F3M07]|uniref:chromophore lyase CpcT/CpeT n=1 Tax=Psychrosphaera sp. F3M07 TaxID=2841560 RepID=UPI001C0978F0|nr:chromophore lyase CpcT/CpeT [Psychrosphaera sp. F3M07]MBU2919610.1 chromophore lyase CpcT/CpeT [Psychrosphaera sp. F3M07]